MNEKKPEGFKIINPYDPKKTCKSCYYENVEKVKLSQDPCRTCFATDVPGNRFPKWKKVA